ncbi:hypothetical protein LIER_40628 [Lithospermum erythrorhizon]|uniref:Reverse transcriptase RNase H-like domain-containing protein n=1 Tax=Lithospermum erythrorhizon TaxID=34254 RepID=A0AAV3QYP2_LITER
MKFPTPGGIGEICGDQKKARICYQTSVPPLNKGDGEKPRKRSRKSHGEVNVVRGEEEKDNSPKKENLGESLQLYLAISDVVVSSVLVREAEGVQKSIYYVSHVLHGAEERYPIIDKAAFALIVAARKLKAYFESHVILVMTDQPLKRVLSSPALSGRLTTWAVELSECDITYIPMTSATTQALADFVIEYTTRPPPGSPKPLEEETVSPNCEWVMHVDGARNDKGAGAGVLITGPQGVTLEYALQFSSPLPIMRRSIRP